MAAIPGTMLWIAGFGLPLLVCGRRMTEEALRNDPEPDDPGRCLDRRQCHPPVSARLSK
jgi:hypothetical protein